MLTTRKLVTGVAVGALALGLFLGKFMDFGIGTGGSMGITSTSPASPNMRSTATSKGSPASRSDIGGVEGDAQHMVLVRITGKEFSIAEWTGSAAEYRAASVGEIARQAVSKDGDSRGVKVRVSRDESSKASAEEQLRKELESAGIPAEAIEWDSGTGY